MEYNTTPVYPSAMFAVYPIDLLFVNKSCSKKLSRLVRFRII